MSERPPDVVVEQAQPADAQAILALQRLAYRSEAALYDDWSIPPLTESLDELSRVFADHVVLRATVDGRLVGSVRARQRERTCLIGRLIVDPELQGRGIGKQLMCTIEALFPAAERFELFTGDRSERNLHLYDRLGYRAFASEAQTPKVRIVYLEKPGPGSPSE
ncbi:MAG: GNAT family N-acetyltransferase [Gaiellaceae bacterium]